MPEQGDIRVVKTKKLVYDTMLNLILHRRFARITVNSLCESAQISRATFYAHFDDKYDFLKVWLTDFITMAYSDSRKVTYEQRGEYINAFIYENRKVLENLLTDADDETLEKVFEVLLSFSSVSSGCDGSNPEFVVKSNIFVGGLISYLKWHVKNRFPKDVEVFNEYLCEIIENYLK